LEFAQAKLENESAICNLKLKTLQEQLLNGEFHGKNHHARYTEAGDFAGKKRQVFLSESCRTN
jgi:hypothetical protein